MGKPANFSIVEDTPEVLCLKDEGPWDVHFTITNDAENVVEKVATRLGNRRLDYIDSEGFRDQLLVKDGKFDGFAPVPAA